MRLPPVGIAGPMGCSHCLGYSGEEGLILPQPLLQLGPQLLGLGIILDAPQRPGHGDDRARGDAVQQRLRAREHEGPHVVAVAKLQQTRQVRGLPAPLLEPPGVQKGQHALGDAWLSALDLEAPLGRLAHAPCQRRLEDRGPRRQHGAMARHLLALADDREIGEAPLLPQVADNRLGMRFCGINNADSTRAYHDTRVPCSFGRLVFFAGCWTSTSKHAGSFACTTKAATKTCVECLAVCEYDAVGSSPRITR
mmetsp:Transcript_85451/g.261337  ORF Transcript_85451/g.261337 Transcript_85451/m.261337 type:complete len:252 (+) Transcript_85451:108-863(+)